MKKIHLFILAFTLTINCIGQNYTDTLILKQQLILTEKQNQNWLDSLKKLPSEKQITAIVERITLDTNIFIRHSYPDRIRLDYSIQEKNKLEGCCKPFLIISPIEKVFNFDDAYDFSNSYTTTLDFLETVNKIKVQHIEILPKNEAIAIWGLNAANGALLLKVTDKKSLRFLKRKYKHAK